MGNFKFFCPSMANFLITSPGLLTEGTTESDLLEVAAAAASGATVFGHGGDDKIKLSSDVTNISHSNFRGNTGNDVISADGIDSLESANVFGGGQGFDTISIFGSGEAEAEVLRKEKKETEEKEGEKKEGQKKKR